MRKFKPPNTWLSPPLCVELGLSRGGGILFFGTVAIKAHDGGYWYMVGQINNF